MNQQDIEAAIQGLINKHKPDHIQLIYCSDSTSWEISMCWGEDDYALQKVLDKLYDDEYTRTSNNLRSLFYDAMKLKNNENHTIWGYEPPPTYP